MKAVDRAVEVITHRDYDLVALVGLSIVLAIFEACTSKWLEALFAGAMGTFAISMIRLRHDIGRRSGLAAVFLDKTPAEVATKMGGANDLLLVGVSLDRTLRNAYAPLERFLKKGGGLRVLVVDPAAETSLKIADRRAYQELGIAQRRAHIETSIKAFRELQEKTKGKVEIKVTDDPLTFGAIVIDGAERSIDSQIVVQHYSYKKQQATEPNPIFIVRPNDGQWFSEFQEELENLWRDGK